MQNTSMNVTPRREWVKPQILDVRSSQGAEAGPTKFHSASENVPHTPTPGFNGPVS